MLPSVPWVSNHPFMCVSCFQIPKFIVTQVRQQNMESQRKQNKERAVRKLLKKITTDKPSERAIPEVGILISMLCSGQ